MTAIYPDSELSKLDEENQAWVIEKVEEVRSIYYDGIRDMVDHFDAQNFNDNEKLAAWPLLESWIRSAYKRNKENSLSKELGL